MIGNVRDLVRRLSICAAHNYYTEQRTYQLSRLELTNLSSDLVGGPGFAPGASRSRNVRVSSTGMVCDRFELIPSMPLGDFPPV